MATRPGRNWRARYLTIEAFEKWRTNDFHDLQREVCNTKKLLWGVLIAVIAIPTAAFFMIAQFILGRLP